MPPPLTGRLCLTSRRLGTLLMSAVGGYPNSALARTPLTIPPTATTRLLSLSSRFPCCSASDASGDSRPPAEYLRAQRDKMRQKFRERIADVKDNIVTVPNALCIARISITPVIGYLVVIECFMPACILFTVAGISDMLDGWIARNYPSQKSMLGSILDPVADKFLISTLFVTLTYAQLIPLALTSVVLLRDVLLIFGGFVRRYQLLEPPFTLRRYFDPSISSVRILPTLVSKANTVLQLLLVTLSLASPVFGYENHPLLSLLCVCTGLTTIYSGVQYATGKAMIPAKKIIEQRRMSS